MAAPRMPLLTLYNKLSKINKLPFILTTALILVSFILPRSEYKTLFLFLVLVPIFGFNKFDPRIPVVYGILLFVLAAISGSLNERYLESQLSMFSYWLLVVGTICILIQLLTNKSSS
jgi:hypothetical protein